MKVESLDIVEGRVKDVSLNGNAFHLYEAGRSNLAPGNPWENPPSNPWYFLDQGMKAPKPRQRVKLFVHPKSFTVVKIEIVKSESRKSRKVYSDS
jgi:hypothetical protein